MACCARIYRGRERCTKRGLPGDNVFGWNSHARSSRGLVESTNVRADERAPCCEGFNCNYAEWLDPARYGDNLDLAEQ